VLVSGFGKRLGSLGAAWISVLFAAAIAVFGHLD
jgi:hypothetical protein